MTQEEKQILLKDLCPRLPYFTIAYVTYKKGSKTMEGNYLVTTDDIDMLYESAEAIEKAHCTIKPYLRPMSSMTEEERKEVNELLGYRKTINGFGDIKVAGWNGDTFVDISVINKYYNWLNERHFDYHRLIEKELALEAPEGMYE